LKKKLAIILTLIFSQTIRLLGYETHSGAVSGTWSAGTHYLSASASVASGTTLTIEAGAVVKFAPNTYINVVGTLDVNGNSSSYVVITSKDDNAYGETISGSDGGPAAGDWQGINIDGGYGYFDYCRVRYGGLASQLIGNIRFSTANAASYASNCQIEYSGYYGIYAYNCSPTISNNTISNNSSHGLYAYSSGAAPTITDNVFNNNSGYGVYLDNIYLASYSGNTGSGNSTNGFGLKGTMNANCSWSCGSTTFPFVLLGLCTINSGYTLTINSGTIFKALSGAWIDVDGTLDVNGESGALVTFTSINDDDYGGDTKGDGSATSPAVGDWHGIIIDNGDYGYFDYCRVRYGGKTSGNTNNANVYFSKSSDSGHFINSASEYSQNYGIHINACNPEISYSTFSNNGSNGAYISGYGATSEISINHNNFISNGADGLYLTSSAIAAIDSNTFNNNSGYGAYLNNLYLYSYSGNTGSGNTTNGFGIYGGNLWENANNTWTSASKSFPFIIVGGGTTSAITKIYQHLTIGANTTLKFTGSGYCYMSDENTGGYVSWSSGSAIWLAGSASTAPVGWDGGVLRFSTYRNWPGEWIIETTSPGECFTGGTYVTINQSGTVLLSAEVTISNELVLTAGTVTLNSNPEDPYSLTFGNSAKIIREAGTLDFQPNFGTAIDLEYSGSTGVTTGYEVPSTNIVNNVTINNSGGVILGGDLNVNGALTLTQGNITTNSNTLTIGSSVSSTGSLSRTSGTIIGNLKRWLAASTVSDVLFPVGTATYYRPANVSFTSAPTAGGTLLATFTASNPGSTGLPVTDDGYEITKAATDGYWTLTSGNGLTDGTYSLDLTATSYSGISDYTDLRLIKRTDAGASWSVSGAHSTGTGSNSVPVVHRTGLTGFSQFGIGSNESDNSLPVELTAFKAECPAGVVVMKWTIESETENLGFMIERNVVGAIHELPSDWEKIASYVTDDALSGRGSTTETQEYAYIDAAVVPGATYVYRLGDVDYSGKVTWHKEVEIKVEVEDTQIPFVFGLQSAYPNPFNPSLTIPYNISEDGQTTLKVYNLRGELVETLINVYAHKGAFSVNWQPQNLSAGLYLLRLESGGRTNLQKVVFMK